MRHHLELVLMLHVIQTTRLGTTLSSRLSTIETRLSTWPLPRPKTKLSAAVPPTSQIRRQSQPWTMVVRWCWYPDKWHLASCIFVKCPVRAGSGWDVGCRRWGSNTHSICISKSENSTRLSRWDPNVRWNVDRYVIVDQSRFPNNSISQRHCLVPYSISYRPCHVRLDSTSFPSEVAQLPFLGVSASSPTNLNSCNIDGYPCCPFPCRGGGIGVEEPL